VSLEEFEDPGPPTVEIDRATCRLSYQTPFGPDVPEEVLAGIFHAEDFLTDLRTGMCYKKEALQTRELSREDLITYREQVLEAKRTEIYSRHENSALAIRLSDERFGRKKPMSSRWRIQ